MRAELIRLLRERPRTVVFVTHDVVEAAHLADRVIVFSEMPASICCELALDLPQPRELTHPILVDAVRTILAGLNLGDDPAAATTPSTT
jgi:ABC-type nitrate/sulfonate/bicarbonate transport system ATPase subunit